MSNFIEKYIKTLDNLTMMSKQAGSRSDYVQGGGGNTSCKLDNKLMAIKASGFRLDQIVPDNGYAVLDYAKIRDFYLNTNPEKLDDVEKSGSEKAQESIQVIDGLPVLRPSVEAGFHSVLDTYVLHTHAVYANLLTCSIEGKEIIAKVMKQLGEIYAIVPYINPGAQLTFAIASEREKVFINSGKKPPVIFMENHGLIVTGETPEYCLELHDKINKAIAEEFGITFSEWPSFQFKEKKLGDTMYYFSQTEKLISRLKQQDWDKDFFTAQPLYPDQLVFLNGQIDVNEAKNPAEFLQNSKPEKKVTIFRKTGEILYQSLPGESSISPEIRTIEETLYCVLFIADCIREKGLTLQTMNEAGKDFIQNWESEKYRKSIAQKTN